MMGRFAFALLSLCFALTGVQCDEHRHKYTAAHINIEVREFRDVSIALFGQYGGEMLDDVLSKHMNEKHHGVAIDSETGTERMKMILYLSEDKHHFFATTPKKGGKGENPLMAMHTELLMRSTETTATIFIKSKNSKQLKKVCGKFLAPLPETPEEMFHAILKIGVPPTSGGFGAKCSDQTKEDDCKKFPVCKAKSRFYQFKHCAARHAWKSDNIFKRCADAKVCYETKIGAELQAHLKESVKTIRSKKQPLVSQESKHKSYGHGTIELREKSIKSRNGGELNTRSTIFRGVEKSFHGWEGEDIFEQNGKKFWMLNKFPSLPVEFISCDDVLAFVEVDSKMEAQLTTEEKELLNGMKALTVAELQTKHGVKLFSTFLLAVLGGMAFVAGGFVVLMVLFALVKVAFVFLAVLGIGALLAFALAAAAYSL